MITCPTCKGDGIGKTGPDPDWCAECGGPGQVFDHEADGALRVTAVMALLLDWQRRTRIEDAAAICGMCGGRTEDMSGKKCAAPLLPPDAESTIWRHDFRTHRVPCTAGPIHDALRENGE